MDIKHVIADHCLDLLPAFVELESYYFAENAATQNELSHYLTERVFSQASSVKIIAAYEKGQVRGFATYTVMYPAPRLSGQMYIKDLFVTSSARGKGVGLALMKYLAAVAVNAGCERLDWTAESINPRAGQFYQAIGASLVSEKEYYRFEGTALSQFAQSLLNDDVKH
ncbi:GNAT family N-acetyltransferase [Veronia pacifica]|uniref:Acetyltransferase n=1 Tax=Veronia pacifica TaxID=1080227 RepID=A0A1C3ESC0_9GAMM|nr:GNAT family N-acetyltransferase [Veronia pacifica]ODA36162.1 acetyltransferase [Veronia pacifica]